jgi:GDP-L-fucose synthase
MTPVNKEGALRAAWQGRRVLVTGGGGFVGSNLLPKLRGLGCDVVAPRRAEYDLLDQQQVRRMFSDLHPDITVHLAARSAGILANKRFPAEFCYQNLLMNTCVLHEAQQAGVKKYVTLIGGCSYPAHAPSPIREEELWNGYPQPESAPYSLAKRMDVVMAGAYRQQYGFDAIVLLAGNLYGPGDNFNLEASHVIPATIRKMVEATDRGDKAVTVWGTGTPVRDFVYVDDVCDVMLAEAQAYSSGEIMNISSGVATTIRELIETVADLCGFRGRLEWDTSKPDGQRHKVYDVSRFRARAPGFSPTPLREGLRRTIEWVQREHATARL